MAFNNFKRNHLMPIH